MASEYVIAIARLRVGPFADSIAYAANTIRRLDAAAEVRFMISSDQSLHGQR
jgi:hypothetical protein